MPSDAEFDAAFDRAVVQAVFDQAALRGWHDVSLAEAARDAGLGLGRVRARFPSRAAVLLRFGVQADQSALAAGTVGEPRERLFDILMARFDALQRHRSGVLALLAALRTDPGTALLLYGATLRSMRGCWTGPASRLLAWWAGCGCMACWRFGCTRCALGRPMRARTCPARWRRWTGAWDRAIQAERMLPGRPPPESPPTEPPPPEPPPPEPPLAEPLPI